MKETLARFGRGVYDTWYGAVAVFLVVSSGCRVLFTS